MVVIMFIGLCSSSELVSVFLVGSCWIFLVIDMKVMVGSFI